MNHCNCYLQEPESNIVDFAIKLTTSGVGKVRLASHKQLFDSRDVALYLFVRNTEDLFCFALTPPISSSCVVKHFFAFSSPICIFREVEDFFLVFDSPVATLRLFYFSASGSFNGDFAHLYTTFIQKLDSQ